MKAHNFLVTLYFCASTARILKETTKKTITTHQLSKSSHKSPDNEDEASDVSVSKASAEDPKNAKDPKDASKGAKDGKEGKDGKKGISDAEDSNPKCTKKNSSYYKARPKCKCDDEEKKEDKSEEKGGKKSKKTQTTEKAESAGNGKPATKPAPAEATELTTSTKKKSKLTKNLLNDDFPSLGESYLLSKGSNGADSDVGLSDNLKSTDKDDSSE